MQKKSLTNKITSCCTLPFGVMKFIVDNLTLNSEADRSFLISKLHQNGTLSIDAWKVWINSGTLESDAALTKSEFLSWFDCDRQPSCAQLKLLIEGYKLGNYDPSDEYGVGWTEVSTFENYNNKVIKKVIKYVGGVGVVPSELSVNVGKYYASAGGFTTDKSLATDFRPEVGSAKKVFDKNNDEDPSTMTAAYSEFGPALKVLDGFVNPIETIWQEIIMPQNGEIYSAYLDNTLTQESASSNVSWGIIPNSEFGSEWTMIKIEGNLNILGGFALHLARYKAPAGGPVLLSGMKGSFASYTYPVSSSFDGFYYSRVAGDVKFYKGKVKNPQPGLNSVKEYIDSHSGSTRHKSIDAFTDFNVKPSNSAAENTANMNAAINAAFAEKKPILLSAGNIKHNGFEYKPGVIIRGAGIGHTQLTNVGGTYTFRCLDEYNSNPYLHGGGISDMALVGGEIADYGVDFRNMFMFKFENLWFSGYKTNSVRLTGVGAASFNYIRVFGGTGFKLLTSDNSSAGYMQANLNEFNFVYFERIPGLCVDIDRGSNIVFRSCNFEFSGTAGNPNTGGVRAKRMSPGNEGIDLVFDQCWSETLAGPFLNLSESLGVTVIRDCMVGNPGNTAANMVVNDGSKLLITGGTKVDYSSTGVRTKNSGETRIDGFARVNTHVEETGGIFKQVVYS